MNILLLFINDFNCTFLTENNYNIWCCFQNVPVKCINNILFFNYCTYVTNQ